MKNRSPVGTFFLTAFIPFYSIYWVVTTGREMRVLGAELPTAWFIIVPFVNIWWMYKYGAAVEHVTNGKTSAILAFIVMWLLGAIGYAIIQDSFNNVSGAPMGNMAPPTPVGPQPIVATPIPIPDVMPPQTGAPAPSMTPLDTTIPALPPEPIAPQPPANSNSI